MLWCCRKAEDCCSECYDSCCRPCCDCCGECCDKICPDDKPAPCHVIFTVMIHIALVIMCIVFLAQDGSKECSNGGKIRAWFICAMLQGIISIAFAFYLYKRFNEVMFEGGETACSAASDIILYDPGVCMYILVAIWTIAWLAVAYTMCGNETVCTAMGGGWVAVLVLLAVHLGLGGFILMMSVCWTCCGESDMRAARERKENEKRARRGGTYDASAAPSVVAMTDRRAQQREHANKRAAEYDRQQQQQQQQPQKGDADGTIAGAAATVIAGAASFLGRALGGGGGGGGGSSDSRSSNANVSPVQQQPVQQPQPQPQQQTIYNTQPQPVTGTIMPAPVPNQYPSQQQAQQPQWG